MSIRICSYCGTEGPSSVPFACPKCGGYVGPGPSGYYTSRGMQSTWQSYITPSALDAERRAYIFWKARKKEEDEKNRVEVVFIPPNAHSSKAACPICECQIVEPECGYCDRCGRVTCLDCGAVVDDEWVCAVCEGQIQKADDKE